MAEEFYQLPESPVYNAETIRKIQDTDPVRASTIVNPVISRLIENTHAVKKLADKAQQEAASAAAAEEYSSESVYNAGSYCTRGGKLYKANQDILSAEPWTEAHWTETNIAAELVAIYTALSNKAPGGYGLGTAATNIPDLNDATKNGWYMNGAGGEAVHAPDNVPGWLVLVCAYADEIVFQTAYRYGSAEGLISARRSHHYLFGGWQPWEWITPQMVPGIEYRTVKRDHDKVVYEKTVQTGALPAGGTKSIAHGASDIGLRLTIRCAFDNDGNNLVGNPGIAGILVDQDNIIITTTAEYGTSYGDGTSNSWVSIAYTKNTISGASNI